LNGPGLSMTVDIPSQISKTKHWTCGWDYASSVGERRTQTFAPWNRQKNYVNGGKAGRKAGFLIQMERSEGVEDRHAEWTSSTKQEYEQTDALDDINEAFLVIQDIRRSLNVVKWNKSLPAVEVEPMAGTEDEEPMTPEARYRLAEERLRHNAGSSRPVDLWYGHAIKLTLAAGLVNIGFAGKGGMRLAQHKGDNVCSLAYFRIITAHSEGCLAFPRIDSRNREPLGGKPYSPALRHKGKKPTTKALSTGRAKHQHAQAAMSRKRSFSKLTRLDVLGPAHRSRISAAIEICGPSVKLQWLCSLVGDVCVEGKRNLIVFCSWPATWWLVEMLLYIVGVPVLSIRAAHAAATRADTHEAFNAPTTVETVLVTNLRLGATSMNLQKGCADLVFLEVPESGNTAAQGIGRVHRIDQTRVQHIYIITANYTWDQHQQARAALKIVTRRRLAGEDDEPLTPEARYNLAEDTLRHEEIVRLYGQMFGLRSPQDQWTRERDLVEKDLLAGEVGAVMEKPAVRSDRINKEDRQINLAVAEEKEGGRQDSARVGKV
ncbi:hypothetical protein V493_03364, partial [Pseudogymnoascus sp. VKM F-4281 (FW-2241)]